ncbi:2-hydroxyhepta-2,4-diene-1,7-dioate isomerase [Klenkia taihuensis]|nr:2-hydroxyhepta-2,4-diene-1,7-dioate isomerase [Klenkia taihuensis]
MLGRLGDPGSEIPVAHTADGVVDLRSVVPDLGGEHLAPSSLTAVRQALLRGGLPLVADAERRRVGAAVARPGAIICVGMNYAAHAAESGAVPPASPVVFLKTPNTLGGPHDPVALPRGSVRTDWEVELGVVIGSLALYLDDPAESLDHVAGYVVANDLSERDFQLEHSGGQWSKGKCSPGFSPLGPHLVTADQVDPTALRLRSWVNGEPRQDSSTADMVFDVAFIIWHLSQYMALDPGDVVLTGTPEGVALSGRFPYLAVGDVVEVEIDGLGRQRQEIVA